MAARKARFRRDDDHKKDRHRRDRGSTAGPKSILKLMKRVPRVGSCSDVRRRLNDQSWSIPAIQLTSVKGPFWQAFRFPSSQELSPASFTLSAAFPAPSFSMVCLSWTITSSSDSGSVRVTALAFKHLPRDLLQLLLAAGHGCHLRFKA